MGHTAEAPTASRASGHLITPAEAGPLPKPGRMIVPGGSLLLTIVKLVSPDENRLTEAAIDVLKLSPEETEDVQATLARAADEARRIRRGPGAVRRTDSGVIDVQFDEKDWTDFLRTESARLNATLDADSVSALHAVGLRQLLSAPAMMGLTGVEPIPGRMDVMMARFENGPYTFRQELSRVRLEALVGP
jgi:hypothetical protein